MVNHLEALIGTVQNLRASVCERLW